MKTKISFCPMCASSLEAGDDDQFECEECEKRFFIQIVEEDEDEDEEEEEEDEDEDEDDDFDEDEDDDEY